jgi:hypothetical protein
VALSRCRKSQHASPNPAPDHHKLKVNELRL